MPIRVGTSTEDHRRSLLQVSTELDKLSPRWTPLHGEWYDETPASTSTITTRSDLRNQIAVGTPLRYKYGDVDYYGIVTAITASLLTIAGAPLDTAVDLKGLYYGRPEMVVPFEFMYWGNYDGGVGTIVQWRWMNALAHLVSFSMRHGTDDTGANNPKVNISIAGFVAGTADGGNGLQASTTWQDNSAVAIDAARYSIAHRALWTINTTVVGTNGDAANLYMTVSFVLA